MGLEANRQRLGIAIKFREVRNNMLQQARAAKMAGDVKAVAIYVQGARSQQRVVRRMLVTLRREVGK